jgi:MFS family permease
MIPSTYRRLLSIRDARTPLIGVLIGRLPIAALPLAVILLVSAETGSFAAAGVVNAAMAVAAGIGLPAQGRLIDRYGQTLVLVICGATIPFALLAFVIAAENGAGTAVLMALVIPAGATIPPLSPALRTLWSDLVPDERLRQSAFALDAVLLEVAFITGPLLVALIAWQLDPGAAILVCAGISVSGTAIFALSLASRRWRPVERHGGFAGPLESRGVLVLLGTCLGFGFALGAIELSLTAFATEEGSPEAVGWLIAIQAVTSLIGGLWYGSREWESTPASRYPGLCLVVALTLGPLALAPSLAGMAPLVALSGFALAPVTAVAYMLVDLLAPRGTSTEAATWLITAIVVGVAAGTATAGAIVSGSDPNWGFVVAFIAALAGWAIAVGGRRLIEQPAAA